MYRRPYTDMSIPAFCCVSLMLDVVTHADPECFEEVAGHLNSVGN